ncbi:hypothetical protein AAKU55_003657 [Oxalobacteraceae bacterium GrIS 1.11]
MAAECAILARLRGAVNQNRRRADLSNSAGTGVSIPMM